MSGRTIKVLAAAVAAVAALAGCGGGPVRTGAAAIVGGDRITVATLGQAVEDWQREFRSDQIANELRARGGPMLEPDIRNALYQLVSIRIVDEAARRTGIRVTGGQVDAMMETMGRERGAASYARSQGLPARYARDMVRWIFIEGQLLRRFGATGDRNSPQSAAAERQALTLLRDTARTLNIKVNPRYGSFDADRIVIADVRQTLSRPESGIG